MLNKKVKILGAGISGLTSAIVLAKAGYNVEVYERNDNVGKRFDGDFQGLMNWVFKEDVLDFMQRVGLTTDFWKEPLSDIDVCGPNKCKFNIGGKRPFVYLVKRGTERGSIDQCFKEQAIKEGVNIKFNKTEEKENFDIIATGPSHDGETDAMAMGCIFDSDAEDQRVIIFDDSLAYNGYSYFFIVNGRGTLATCIFGYYNKISDYLKKTEEFLKKNYSFNIKNKRKFSGFGNFYLLKGNDRYVGEAGGFQDFLWGFGMRYAMISGNLAAQSIVENKEYKFLVKKELQGIMKSSVVNRFWFSFLGKYSYQKFMKMWKKFKNPFQVLSKLYKPNLLSFILYPIAKIYFRKNIKDRTSK